VLSKRRILVGLVAVGVVIVVVLTATGNMTNKDWMVAARTQPGWVLPLEGLLSLILWILIVWGFVALVRGVVSAVKGSSPQRGLG
jgi:hypothetical protein